MPCFSTIHDDSIYFVCAKSLAAGTGYRIVSLPGAPYQTKYPPVYPLLLSVAWRLNPSFPSNLGMALALNWACVPLLLCLVFVLYRDLGFGEREALGVLLAFAVSPAFLLLGSWLLSELPFTVLLVAVLLLLERAERSSVAVAAGLVASVAALTRSAGMPLLAVGFVFFWLKRRRRSALWFAAAMLPGTLAWMVWTRAHRLPTHDPLLMYYTDYIGYEIYNVDWRSLPVFLWRNADEMFRGLGSYLLAPAVGGLTLRIASDVVAAAGIHGMVRLWRRVPSSRTGTLFCLLYALPLLFWHYPPTQRLLFPVLPWFLAGLYVELAAVVAMLRLGWRRPELEQKIAAGVLGALVASLLLSGVVLQAITHAVVLPRVLARCRREMAAERASFRWIEANVPPGAKVLASHDALLYLSTGRHAMRVTLPPKPFYLEDRKAVLSFEPELAGYARRKGFAYVSWFPFDGSTGRDGGISEQLVEQVRGDQALTEVYSSGQTALYRLR